MTTFRFAFYAQPFIAAQSVSEYYLFQYQYKLPLKQGNVRSSHNEMISRQYKQNYPKPRSWSTTFNKQTGCLLSLGHEVPWWGCVVVSFKHSLCPSDWQGKVVIYLFHYFLYVFWWFDYFFNNLIYGATIQFICRCIRCPLNHIKCKTIFFLAK